MLPFVVLVGLPGVGKSAAGRLAAQQLGCVFMDFDQEIEKREGQSVSEIFRIRGEPYFRQLESTLTRELISGGFGVEGSFFEPGNGVTSVSRQDQKNIPSTPKPRAMILAPGGGWITNSEAAELMRPKSRIVYLKVSPETALARMGGAEQGRPLLAGGITPLDQLKRLYDARKPLYEGANYTIDTENLTLPEVASKIAELAGNE